MLYLAIINYKTNYIKRIIIGNFLLIVKSINFLKIKKKKYIYFLNIKQIIIILHLTNKWIKNEFKNSVLFITFKSFPIKSTIDAIFKLILISNKNEKNNVLNINNIFKKMINIVWTNIGNYDLIDFLKININKLNLIIESIDKIPYLTKFLIIKNIRISNANRVRLGAYIKSGTTIMSEGYVNFNTYIGKNCMIEGRVSSGVYVSDNTDIGGSSSIMGTLSGGGSNVISIGNNCLLGANSGIGISIGNNCIIEAGLYITSGSKIKLIINDDFIFIKAKKLSFINNLIFYRNSINGSIECCKNKINIIKINAQLHKN